MFSKVTGIYFSATGTNMRSVTTIAREFADRMEVADVTVPGNVEGDQYFGSDELVVIGAPVYGGRIYKGAMERFEKFHGDNTTCIVTVTYGNRHYDDALLELCDFMKKQGFCPVAAAALVGQHTFGEIQMGRPNMDDMEEDRQFAAKVKEKLAGEWEEVKVPGNFPYKDGGNGGKFRPLTNMDRCDRCGSCITECPTGAVGKDFVTIDDDKCISCFRCIRKCSQRAKHMEVPAYQEFAKNFTERLAARRENEYFV